MDAWIGQMNFVSTLSIIFVTPDVLTSVGTITDTQTMMALIETGAMLSSSLADNVKTTSVSSVRLISS